MTGMNAHTGKALSGNSHLQQSVQHIIRTLVNSVVMHRNYGVNLMPHIDQPFSPRRRMLIFSAVSQALINWEPRLKITQLQMDINSEGQSNLRVIGKHSQTQQPVDVTTQLVLNA